MSKLTLDDFPLGVWREHDTARCPDPQCRGRVEFRRYLKAQRVGTFSLAGVQTKFPAVEAWEGRCVSCGATGDATPYPSTT